jgi:hypothetical protein
MKANVNLFRLIIPILSISCFFACNKSSSGTGGSGTMINMGDLAGNWAAKVFINTTNGHTDTALATGLIDTLQFTSTGKLNAAYYTQFFDTLTSHLSYVRTVDSASYTFVNDTTIHIAGHTSLYLANNSSDVFVIHYLDALQLQLYAPDNGGSGGYLYIYTRF